MHEIEARWRIFRLLALYFGKVVKASFIQETEGTIPGITRILSIILLKAFISRSLGTIEVGSCIQIFPTQGFKSEV